MESSEDFRILVLAYREAARHLRPSDFYTIPDRFWRETQAMNPFPKQNIVVDAVKAIKTEIANIQKKFETIIEEAEKAVSVIFPQPQPILKGVRGEPIPSVTFQMQHLEINIDQLGTIRPERRLVMGRVFDREFNHPFQGGRICLLHDEWSGIVPTRTDHNGIFLFKDVPVSHYRLSVELEDENIIIDNLPIGMVVESKE